MLVQQTTSLLAALPAFRPISSEKRAMVAQSLQVTAIKKQTPFVLTYPPATYYLLPLTPNLTLHRTSNVEFGMRLPQGVLWPVTLQPNEQVQIRCVTEGQLGILSTRAMAELLQLSPRVRQALMQSICLSESHISSELEQYTCNDLSGRVARLLLDLEQSASSNIIHYVHVQLAALLNAQRESVSVIIGRFRRAGWITTSYGRIKIDDHNALLRLANHY